MIFKDEEDLKVKFLKYEEVRQIGEFNMLDLRRGCAATGCTPEQYMFIQNTVQTGGDYELWYVDKAEFNGSTVEPQKIELAGRG